MSWTLASHICIYILYIYIYIVYIYTYICHGLLRLFPTEPRASAQVGQEILRQIQGLLGTGTVKGSLSMGQPSPVI